MLAGKAARLVTMTIRLLPANLVNQIAAGEVVERPASVVKELVENSIDAAATRIEVDIELGGRRLIRIKDNGEGMGRDDAVLAFERHATSKIRDLDDLGRIATLGFRGEALASIASVSRVELITKTAGELAGTFVEVEGGRLTDVKDASRDTGTTVTVRDLFFNTPARRKFMRSEATENYHLTTIVTHYALAHPEIAFRLVNNGRETIRVAAAKDLRERAFQIFGGELLESLLPVAGGREFLAGVTGFVSAPRERRTNRDAQYFFVNQRFVRDRTISEGLSEGYRSVLPSGVYPVAFLFLDVPYDEIDVNVHPAKTEVRFRRTEAIKDAIAEAVRDALSKAGIEVLRASATSSTVAGGETLLEASAVAKPALATEDRDVTARERLAENDAPEPITSPRTAAKAAHAGSVTGEPALFATDDLHGNNISTDFELLAGMQERTGGAAQIPSIGTGISPASAMPPFDSAERLVGRSEVSAISGHTIRPIAQLHESFIIAVDDEGLLLVDQHVAHERILFDKFRRTETDRPAESQNLLLPETLDLTPAQAETFEAIEEYLTSLGFGLMRLSGRTVAIKSIPADIPPANVRNLFAEVIDSVDSDRRSSARNTLRDEIAASLACKAAIKINTPLTTEKMQWLIDRLLLTSSPTTCPHGRPVILRLSMKAIERGFHRS